MYTCIYGQSFLNGICFIGFNSFSYDSKCLRDFAFCFSLMESLKFKITKLSSIFSYAIRCCSI